MQRDPNTDAPRTLRIAIEPVDPAWWLMGRELPFLIDVGTRFGVIDAHPSNASCVTYKVVAVERGWLTVEEPP